MNVLCGDCFRPIKDCEEAPCPNRAMEGHENHKTVWAVAGAPGTGKSLYCYDCGRDLWSNIRVLEPWEVE